MNTMTGLGIDIGEHSFELHGQDTQGHQVLRKRMTRG
ncbi:transposase IS116/IS110/IS902 family domain protein [Pseudomonas fluorescens]|uniref:Transposase IS116/IS110/IS902 family domain protein n=1 Tax=Pseudomonas fluorescens TaxID=294 RepID=A0A0P8XKS3_PSEFL|nr:transposase IS116/IS110/IS902 family domain protein [Pseudomonas fluorescens]